MNCLLDVAIFAISQSDELSLDKIGLEGVIADVLKSRLDEIQRCILSSAPLATIFLCGSTLEGILLGIAQKYPQKFNQAKSAPKNAEKKVKQFHEWKRILENLRASNIFSILFTGGEPFIRDDFIEIYLYAKKLGFRISIYTNGYSLSEESLFYLEKYKPQKIYITLYGVNSHSYQSMVHVNDAYKKVLNNIFRFQKAGINLVLRTQLTPFTEMYLEKMKSFADEIGVPFNFGSVIVPDLNLEDGESNICNLDPKKIVEYEELDLNRKDERARQDDIFEFTMKTNPFDIKIPWSCGAVSSSLTITNQGYMVPCVQLPFPKYDLADTSVELAWTKLYGDIQSLLEEEEVQDQIKNVVGVYILLLVVFVLRGTYE